MSTKKRLAALLLALAMLAALSVTAAAAGYSDMDGHWAESYVTRLTELGYLNGYSDGTFKPENQITACEAIALLARFYPLDEDVEQWVHEDYGEFVEEYIDPNLEWAYDEIEICLAAGVLSQKELTSLRLTAPIEKELLSVLLIRALQLTDEAEAADGSSLTFADVDDISASYRGYVEVLVEHGIIVGDNHNRFTPHTTVTRAVVATMVSRGIDYVNSEGRFPVLSGYEGYAKYEGVVTDVGVSSLTMRDTDGVSRVFSIPDSARVMVGGVETTFGESLEGCYTTVRIEDGKVASVTAVESSSADYVQGRLTEVTKISNGYSLQVEDLDTGKTSKASISTGASVTVDGAAKEVTALKTGLFLTLTLKSKTVTEAVAVSGSYTINGTIASLTYGAPVVLELSHDDGSGSRWLLDLTDLPDITRGDNASSIERLGVGDAVVLTIKDSEVTKIASKASDSTIDGTVTSIVATTGGTTWVLRDTAGEDLTLTVDPTANAYQGSKAILVSAIQAGDTVSVVTDGTTITEIYLKASTGASSSTKLNGTVLLVNESSKVITVTNTSGKLIYITLKSGGSIVDTSTGSKVSLTSLEPNDQLVAYGTYSDASNFQAASIILES